MLKNIQILVLLSIFLTFLNSCSGFNKTDAKKFPPDPKERVRKNLEEGRGFTVMGGIKKRGGSGDFDFASSNELWRASLDTIDFMPLLSANYSGGIIITYWYNDGKSNNESIKITIRFLSNEIRVDSLDVKIFMKNCVSSMSCKVTENQGSLIAELKKSILKKATIYKKQKKEKNFKEYKNKS